jgi:hypothetical protein
MRALRRGSSAGLESDTKEQTHQMLGEAFWHGAVEILDEGGWHRDRKDSDAQAM